MTFAEALNAIKGGEIAWRTSWKQDKFVKQNVEGNPSYQDGKPYNPSNLDKAATDWTAARSDKRPAAVAEVKEPVTTAYHDGKDPDPSKI